MTDIATGRAPFQGRRAAPREPPQRGRVLPDRDEVVRFVEALFTHAGEGGTVAVRAFYDDKRGGPPCVSRSVPINGAGLAAVADAAYAAATRATRAGRPVVVCPPLATFNGDKADEASLREGLVLSVELDERAAASLSALRGHLGQPTLVVASGGLWTDTATGEVGAKLHAHWRLKEPTRTPEEHARLKRARALACELVGADPTAKTTVHPMRWAGTVHLKDPADPRLCRIEEENPGAEIALEEALAELEGLAALRGAAGEAPRPAADPAGDADLLLACAARIPNPDLEWFAWNRLGMAFWRASAGGEAGFRAFDAFSAKCGAKYDAAATRARWEHYRTSPPGAIGVGTLVHEARKADPAFRSRKPRLEPEPAADPAAAWAAALAAEVARLNRRFFVVMQSGKAAVCSFERDDTLKRDRLTFSRAEDVKLFFANRRVRVGTTAGGEPVHRDLGSAWLTHPARRTFDRLTLLPLRDAPEGAFNLWRGWGVEPGPGDWPMFRAHLLDVVCKGNEQYFDYLYKWMAYCVQYPGSRPEVAVVMRGLKGSGKGTVGQVMVDIFRHHALQIFQAKHLTGAFNAHLVDALFLFIDEAFWAGDKQGEGVLKGLITEPQHMIEPKGINPFPVANLLKLLMSSNNDWVVPATADERRFFVLDVSDDRVGDVAYFKGLHAALKGGERGAFFAHLRALDLSGFSPREAPHTEGLNVQKLIGLSSVQRFWLDCLREGEIVGAGGGDHAHLVERQQVPAEGEEGWPAAVATRLLHAAYLSHARDHGERHPKDTGQMVMELGRLWPGEMRRKRLPPAFDPKRPEAYLLPPLAEVRARFAETMRMRPEEAGFDLPKGGRR